MGHNHPSGEVSPSDRDIQSTNDLEKAGKILGIAVFDHLIITEYGWFSFKDEGKM